MEKIIQVTKSAMPPYEEYCEEIKDIWDSRWLTNAGVKHQSFQRKLESFFAAPYVELFANGHLALELAIKALELTGEIITTPFTFVSTTQAILNNGLTPVFCDIEDKWYTLDADKIERLITEKTSAILPVHVYGNVCEWEKIHKLAEKYSLKVIYDAAHAFAEEIKGVNIANLGDVSMFSFHATKVFHSVEGGCLTMKDKSLQKELFALRQFGICEQEDVQLAGINAKMTEFHAAMGLCNLHHLDEYIEKRKKCVDRYRERLSDINGITLCPVQEGVKSNFAYFPVVFDKEIFGYSRNEVMDKLAKRNILARKYFYPLTSNYSVVRKKYNVNETPIAKYVSDNVLTLPLYADLTISDVDRICNIILA